MNKILIDHCLSPRIAYALNCYYFAENRKFNYVALRDKFPPNTKDIDWIKCIAQSKDNWAFITNDRLRKNQAEINAFQSSGLVGFVFSKGMMSQSVNLQLSQIFKIINKIENKIISHDYSRGKMFEIPVKSSRFQSL